MINMNKLYPLALSLLCVTSAAIRGSEVHEPTLLDDMGHKIHTMYHGIAHDLGELGRRLDHGVSQLYRDLNTKANQYVSKHEMRAIKLTIVEESDLVKIIIGNVDQKAKVEAHREQDQLFVRIPLQDGSAEVVVRPGHVALQAYKNMQHEVVDKKGHTELVTVSTASASQIRSLPLVDVGGARVQNSAKDRAVTIILAKQKPDRVVVEEVDSAPDEK
jgi:hypothetical protein